jgi:cathepsin B
MMMTDRTCIASNGSVKFEYSAEDLLTCCSYCVPSSKSNTCQRGGIVYYAVKYWIEEGVVSGGHVGSGRVNFRSSNKKIF